MVEATRKGYAAPIRKNTLTKNTNRQTRNGILLRVRLGWDLEKICASFRGIDPEAVKKVCELGEQSKPGIPLKDYAPIAAETAEANAGAANEFAEAADSEFDED